jgi:UDP:flavonoid glycosyltransferase YjiC (YdhE family)
VTIAQALFDFVHPLAFALHTIPLNRVRREFGLTYMGWDLRGIYTWADQTLYADIPELIPTRNLPANHHYIGPVFWSPGTQCPNWWKKLPSERPMIYITLGSSGRSTLLPTVLEALADMPVTSVAATAGRITMNKLPNNAFVADYLPGDAAAARSQLVICNGGSPTTQQSIAQGTPVLGIPSNLDQHLNMLAVRRRGAGETIRSEQVSARKVREIAMGMLETPLYTQAAARLAREFSNYRATDRFAQLVKDVIQSTDRLRL